MKILKIFVGVLNTRKFLGSAKGTGFQLFQRVGNPIFASYLGIPRTPNYLTTYLLFLVDFLRKTNLPT